MLSEVRKGKGIRVRREFLVLCAWFLVGKVRESLGTSRPFVDIPTRTLSSGVCPVFVAYAGGARTTPVKQVACDENSGGVDVGLHGEESVSETGLQHGKVITSARRN